MRSAKQAKHRRRAALVILMTGLHALAWGWNPFAAPKPEFEEVQDVPAPQSETATPEPIKPPKEIDFEITNPDEIDMNDKGQLGLF